MFPFDRSKYPREPGCYLFKDIEGEIIYVGKAKVLRERLSQYFSISHDQSAKTKHLVARIAGINTFVVDNEVEALLLENKLIKQHKPKYNIALKDSKTYAYIKITDEKYPRILSTRNVTKDGTYFGPYVDGFLRRELVMLIVKLFKLRTCDTLPKRACLNYHIGLCTAPCINNVDLPTYLKQVDEATQFLKGESAPVLARLHEEMKVASEHLKYEAALEKRKQIESLQLLEQRQKVDRIRDFDQDVIAFITDGKRARIELFTIARGVISGKKQFIFDDEPDFLESFVKMYYSSNKIPSEIILNKACWHDEQEHDALELYLSKLRGHKVTLSLPQRGEKLALVELVMKNAIISSGEHPALLELRETLNLPVLPSIIECFDISNLGTDVNVAGMVRFVDGNPDKSNYRKFNIRSRAGQDDFASMQEAVFRRYKRLLDEKAPLPDLIVVDGGKGQLSAALMALSSVGAQIPIVALAKKLEELYLPGEEDPRRYPKNGQMMLMLRRIRDEVHRFSLAYNRKKRQMKLREDTP